MRLAAKNIPISSFVPSAAKKEHRGDILRLIDQTKFDDGNNGGCQTAALVCAIEKAYGEEIPYEEMKKFYTEGDRVYEGHVEKVERIMRWCATRGINMPGVGLIKAVDIKKIPPKDATFQKLWDAWQEFDCVLIGLAGRSGFFSPATGKQFAEYKLPASAGHAMFLAETDETRFGRQFDIPNTWGEDWGDAGWCYLTEKKFDQLRFWQINCCNFDIVSSRTS